MWAAYWAPAKIWKSSTSLHLCKDFLHFFCILTVQGKSDPGIFSFFQCNKIVYTECFQGDGICHVYFYLIFSVGIRSGNWSLQCTDCNMNLLTNFITDIHWQFTTFLHGHQDYLFWDSVNIPLIYFSFLCAIFMLHKYFVFISCTNKLLMHIIVMLLWFDCSYLLSICKYSFLTKG